MFLVEAQAFAVVDGYLEQNRFVVGLSKALFESLHQSRSNSQFALSELDVQGDHVPEASWISLSHDETENCLALLGDQTNGSLSAEVVCEFAAGVRNVSGKAPLIEFP